MTKISATSSHAAKHSKTVHKRYAALRKLANVLKKAPWPHPEAKLELLDHSLYKTDKGKALEFYIDEGKDEKAMSAYDSVIRVMIDETNKEFFYQGYDNNYGPFKLPKGVHLSDMSDDGSHISRGKTKYEKAISKLKHVVKKNLTQALLRGETNLPYVDGDFRSPSTGEALYHTYTDRDTARNHFNMPGEGLLLGKDQFWVELIPGYSGNCIGPFDYPKNFDIGVIKAKDRADEVADNSTTTDSYESGSSGGSFLGGDSSDYLRPAPHRTLGGGGSGSWPSNWGPAPGGSGS